MVVLTVAKGDKGTLIYSRINLFP